MRIERPVLAVLCGLALGLLAPARGARAEGDAEDFRQTCFSCHTIGGGRLVGPDLKDVTTRRPKDWLVRFVTDPAAMIQGGDPYAVKLLSEARNVMMPTIAGMSRRRAEALLDVIEAESKKPESRFASSGVSDRPFTPADVDRGRGLFLGTTRLANGGTACLSCHSAGSAGPLGGGRLGPDLSDVFARLEGRKALGAWLLSPPTPTMKPAFQAHPLDPDGEILPLMAFFKDTLDRHESVDAGAQRLTFLILAVAGAAAALLLMDLFWKRRFRSVRSSLVKGQS